MAKRIESFSRELQIDVVDGIFVSNTSWPYGEGEMKGSPMGIVELAKKFDIEMDLMIDDALGEIPKWIEAKVKRVVVHVESCFDVRMARELCDAAHVELGVSASNDTPLDMYLEALEHAHYAQCMGIRRIGVQGEPFDESVFVRIAAVRAKFPAMTISVDGSVNKESIARLSEAGVTRLISGSAILSQPDAEVAYKELLTLVKT